MLTINDPRSKIVITLRHAAEYLGTLLGPEARWVTRDYHDRKSVLLLEAKADLILAEARIDSWTVDLGINGCLGE